MYYNGPCQAEVSRGTCAQPGDNEVVVPPQSDILFGQQGRGKVMHLCWYHKEMALGRMRPSLPTTIGDRRFTGGDKDFMRGVLSEP